MPLVPRTRQRGGRRSRRGRSGGPRHEGTGRRHRSPAASPGSGRRSAPPRPCSSARLVVAADHRPAGPTGPRRRGARRPAATASPSDVQDEAGPTATPGRRSRSRRRAPRRARGTAPCRPRPGAVAEDHPGLVGEPEAGVMKVLIRRDRSTSPPVVRWTPAAGTPASASSEKAVGSTVPYSIRANSWSWSFMSRRSPYLRALVSRCVPGSWVARQALAQGRHGSPSRRPPRGRCRGPGRHARRRRRRGVRARRSVRWPCGRVSGHPRSRTSHISGWTRPPEAAAPNYPQARDGRGPLRRPTVDAWNS